MTEMIRLEALQAALKCGVSGIDGVLDAAQKFAAFLAGDDTPAAETPRRGRAKKADEPAADTSDKQSLEPATGNDVTTGTAQTGEASSDIATAPTPTAENPTSDVARTADVLSLDDIRREATLFTQHEKGGVEAFGEILKEIGAPNLSGVPSDRYGDLKAAMDAKLASGVDPLA